jgi:hypothetical protein
MVTTSRRAGRVTNKTKLLIYRGSDKVDLGVAEVIVWENQHDGNSSSSDGSAQPHHVGAKGVESNELLVSHPRSTFLFDASGQVSYAFQGVVDGQSGWGLVGWRKEAVQGLDAARFGTTSFGLIHAGFHVASRRDWNWHGYRRNRSIQAAGSCMHRSRMVEQREERREFIKEYASLGN